MAYQFQQPYLGLSAGLQTIHGASGGGVGGWVELGRTTLGSAGDTLAVGSLANKRYLMLLYNTFATGGNASATTRFNVDSGSNYADRRSDNGVAVGTLANRSQIVHKSSALDTFDVSFVSNLTAKEKLFINHYVDTGASGAATAPNRFEITAKWANTTDAISTVGGYNLSAGDFNTGSEVVVLGWDPADTHTTNFWEELASVELGGANANLSSGTITAKKYLWIQAFIKKTSASTEITVQYNNDTGSNYGRRKSNDGGADGTDVSQGKIDLEGGTASNTFFNMFVINNSANEKLGICNMIRVGTTGAGTAPNRTENVNKWANTSAQITEIDLNSVASTFASGSILKVWGSD